jgi:lipopolysaccharide assembly outer membrane protein LptD (OstA)
MNTRFRGFFALSAVPPLLTLFILLALLFFGTAQAVNAQEESPDGELLVDETAGNERVPVRSGPPEMTPEQNRINMDIRTSTLSELAAWCRSLGLSEGGTSADLARRLRDYYVVSAQEMQGDDRRKIITIESARSTEYFTIETVDEDYARLSGEVKISLKDGDALHRIRAWNILFNRTRNIITASGGVEYVKEEGDKIETFRGDSITVDLDNWSSIFLGGASERTLQGDNTTYLFAGTVISRDEEEVIILNKGSISNANNADSLWSLKASRVWLLPGSDFAIFNAVLKVGEIPVLYIPFFYYPADEVVFHPVIGMRTREGNFLQTTTYLLGRPKVDSSSQSSLSRILGNSKDMEKTREGMFLRSTGKKIKDTKEVSLKAIVDWYANLGAFIGTELDLPAKGLMGATSITLGVGLTRTVALDERGNYTPFYPSYDGSTDWNYSNLFSFRVPFRYRFKGHTSLSGKYGSLSLDMPFYSDPVVDLDFDNRSEEMDWVNMIQQGAAMEESSASQTYLGNFSWQLSGRLTPTISRLTPYISNFSVSSFSSTLNFRYIDTRRNYPTTDIKHYSPSSFFYVPETATLYSLSASIAGTPFSWGGSTTTSQTGSKTDDIERPDPLKDIGVPRSPFEDKEKEDEQTKDQSDKLIPPVLNQRFDLPRIGSNKISIIYRLAPSSATTLKFDYNKWKEYSDIDWNEVSTIISNFNGDGSITFNFDHSENLYSNAFTFTGNGAWRQISYLNEEAQDFLSTNPGTNELETDPDKVSAARLQEFRQSFFTTSYGLTSTLRPLYQNPIFKSSSLSYNLKGLVVRSKFDNENSTGDNPQWDLEHGAWDKEKIDTHQFSVNIAAQVMDKSQTLSFITDLPFPSRDAAFTWRAGIRAWISQTDANMKIVFPEEDVWRKLDPLYITETLALGSYGNFSQNLVWNMEDRKPMSSTTSLNLSKWGFTASYSAATMRGYEYIPSATNWVEKTGEPRIQPRDFKLAYSQTFNRKELWDNRLQFNVNIRSNMTLDLQRYTNSNFFFSLGFTLGISNFLDFSFATNSENAYIYRYFRNMPFFNDAPIDIPSGPQNNLFLDLMNSFRFDDNALRQSSGFKMKGFQIKTTHYLGDWRAELDWTLIPERTANSRNYALNSKVSFLVKWVPISELKSDITYNKNTPPTWIVK